MELTTGSEATHFSLASAWFKAAFYLWAGRSSFFINTCILALNQGSGTLELTVLGREQPATAENNVPCKGNLIKGPGLTRVCDQNFQDLRSMLTPSGRGEQI